MGNEQETNGRDNLTETLKFVLEELNQPPYGLYVEIEEYDRTVPKWTVTVSRFTAEINGEEIKEAESRYGDLRTALKNLVFEKFQWAVCEA